MQFYLQSDRFNEKRSSWVYTVLRKHLNVVNTPSDADCFIVVGGDGSLLSAVRDPQRQNKPILALNGGTVGANLIDVTNDNIDGLIDLIKKNSFTIKSFPVLEINATSDKGENFKGYAFNDVWIDRLDAVSVRYDMNLSKKGWNFLTDGFLSGDGVLFSTALGSTGYSRMLSDTVLPHDSLDIVCAPMLSAINKNKVPAFIMSPDDTMQVRFHDIEFRSTRMALDGHYVKTANGVFSPETFNIKLCEDKTKWVKMLAFDDFEFHLKRLNFICGMRKN
ncbi:NAD(+)/NADH kinase [Photobacterium kishitanii]|uniref:NAD(+) kinase n=1 Tax=Photobacterium kishitanii TaxID=318456 RepID=A0A2T3KMD5_9GAMM|nr:NAD(+)/NADH kinase [Photobacterium kishitanii]PSV00951.1 hypothetical protein C9J27_02695 [Photobacterium kishitanii]